jgi:pimeloyl-ACP methyl ester carboxylesterase
MLSWLTQPGGDGKDPNFKKITREPLLPPCDHAFARRRRRPSGAVPVTGYHGLASQGQGRARLVGLRSVDDRRRIDPAGVHGHWHRAGWGYGALPYERLCRHLQGQYDVMPFPYDWRLSVETEAARLAKAVKVELARHGRAIRFLAHSMGGLVVRMMITQEPELWEKVCAKGGRLVMLGTPNRGSYVIPRLLFRVHPTLRMLALADFRTSTEQLAAIVSRYPGVLEMLPENNDPDFFDHAWWKSEASASAPDAGDLKNVKKLRAGLENAVDPAHMIYVAGSARKTPSGIILDRNGRVEWLTTPLGDGTVPYALGLLKNVATYYMNAAHGNLTNYLPGFAAVTELLESGSTQELDRHPPARVRGEEVTEVIRDDEPLLFPSEEELLASAMGAEIAKPEVDQLPPLQITVAHGDLRQAVYPLAIGHYDRDTIVSAEEELDRQLGGRLSRRFQMDLYPGAAGSAEIVLAPDCSPPGGLIIGLGEVGGITPEKVRSGVTEAVSVRVGLIRQFRTADFEKAPRQPRGNNALVIGDTKAAFQSFPVPSERPGRSPRSSPRVVMMYVQGSGTRIR